MTIKVVDASDVVDILYGDKIPVRGLTMRGALVYEDGVLLGVATANLPWHPAVECWVDPRGEFVRVFYRPYREALDDALGQST
jgi:hypothetical protein